MSSPQEIAMRLLEDGESPSPDWQPPDWWIPVPEPGDYDIYILILALSNMNFNLMLRHEVNNYIGEGHVHCDWGDGTEDDYYERGYPLHTYAESGQYLIRITGDENASFFYGGYGSQAKWQILKTGKKIAFMSEYYDNRDYNSFGSVFPSEQGLKYVQINHERGVPVNVKNNFFQSRQTLQKISLAKKISGKISDYTFQNCWAFSDYNLFGINTSEINTIGRGAFMGCYGIETAAFPNCTSVEYGAFSNCFGLKSVYMPNCTSVGDYAFDACYNLQEIILAEDCTFGKNSFQNCYSLYPRPDGSIN